MTSPAKRRFFFLGRPRKGVALVLVLAFVVLLASIIVAFFTRVQSEQQISRSSSNQAKVKLLVDGAVDTIVGDLKQQIAAGASATNTFADGSVFYTITNSAKMVPERTYSGATNTDYANLVSFSGTPMYSGATNRATNVATTDTNAAGRGISKDRWNKPLFLPDSAKNIFDQVKWITVSRKGENTATSSQSSLDQANSITGRYAYVIYDEGGLLDINVAGYPDKLVGNAAMNRKIGLPYVNLTDLKDSAGGDLFTRNEAKTLTDWRDYATGQTVSAAPTPENAYAQSVLSNKTGFLQSSNFALAGGESDRKFIGRQQLIDFVLSKLNSAGTKTALQYLTTFSRDLNQPSYVSAVQKNASAPKVLAANKGGNSAVGGDRFINPSFPTVRVQTSFTRNDGSTANVGEPLVKKRFALNRLVWITYKGPSAERNTAATATTGADGDIGLLKQNGITEEWLKLGTRENIQKYFGLSWDGTNNRWKYDVHVGGSPGNKIIMLVGRPTGTGADAAKYVQDANREPDFFELLKAGITVGSLGKTAATLEYGSGSSASAVPSTALPPGYAIKQVPANLRYNFDSSVDYHIIQIGANILSEVNPTSYPVRITFDDGSARGAWEFQGVTDLPYLSYVFNGVLRTRASNPAANYGNTTDGSPLQYPRLTAGGTVTEQGNAYAIQVPAVWNPYDPNGTQSVLRPSKFRIVIDSNDPVSLVNGSPNENVWCAGLANGSATATTGGNQGLGTNAATFSYDATANATSKTGSRISDSVTFTDTTSNGSLFREPTLIFRTSYTGGSASRTAGNIISIDPNPLAGGTDPAGTPFAPLVLGKFPLAFQRGTDALYSGTGVIGHGSTASAGNNRVYFTYRMQYQDPNDAGNWITYDTKYGRTTHGLFSFHVRGNFSPCVIKGPDPYNPFSWAAAIDPRTARFGLMLCALNLGRNRLAGKGSGPLAPPPDSGWIYDSSGNPAISQSITYPIRPDFSSGFFFSNVDRGDLPPGGRTNGAGFCMLDGLWAQDAPFPSFSAGWTRPLICTNEGHGPTDVSIFPPGMYAQNNPSVSFYAGRYSADGSFNDPAEGPVGPAYYADADGVVRRASGAYVPVGTNTSASSPVGLPTISIQGYPNQPASLKTPARRGSAADTNYDAASQSRPLLLHRPFRSVAELGYVFRDVPWKNLDFFTPESGDAALLDLFCINETSDPNGLVAGKVNLNTRQASALTAIVAGAYVDDPKVNNTTIGSLSNTMAKSIGTALRTRTVDTTTSYGPLQNVSELVGKWQSAVRITPGITYKPVVAGANCGIDLPSGNYTDGKLSYVGFSGNTITTSGKDLSAVFTPTSLNTVTESLAYVKRFREAPVRALASVGQTRVWNLLIDVVAQTGRYPQSASTLDKFVAEGEQRYWVHVAIDRLTGQVIDKQIEVVKE